jgi:hypothetical protein
LGPYRSLAVRCSSPLFAPSETPCYSKPLATTGHEQVVFCHNHDAGLKAIIAIHNTVLGPALGGVRMRPTPAPTKRWPTCCA